MKLTESQMKQARKMKVPPEMIVFADLLYLGYSEVEAYQIAYIDDESLSLSMQKRKRMAVMGSTKFKELYEQRREQTERYLSVPNETELIELIGSKDVAKEILLSAKAAPVGSKERALLFFKYDEIVNDAGIFPTNEQRDATDNIQFFFNEKCENQCPYHIIYMRHWKRFFKEHKVEDIENGNGMNLKPVIEEVNMFIGKVIKDLRKGKLIE